MAILVFSVLPIYRLLGASEATPHRRASVTLAEATFQSVTWGTLVVVLMGTVLAFLVPGERLARVARDAGDRLLGIPHRTWAVGLAVWGVLAAAFVNRFLYRGYYTNIDEMTSFIQARYFAEGMLAGPLPAGGEAWLIPNMLMVDAGWVSQFPPSHLVLMALGVLAGMPTLVGPVLFGFLLFLSALVFPRLLPDLPRTARAVPLLLAVSPYFLFVGAGGLSHTTAGAFCMLALYASLRARDGSWAWALLAGAAVGVAVLSRPWISLLLGTLATAGIWLPALRSRTGAGSWLGARVAGTVVGGVPFAVALGWYNSVLFGSPTTLGYLAAFGERHKLGFHTDPWGQTYGITESLGFTSTDLLAFGTQLLETPFPLGAAIGLWLLFARRLPRGAGFLLAWALVPVLGNAIYWFHDIRMLYEGGPAWMALTALALVPMLQVRDRTPTGQPASGSADVAPTGGSRRRIETQGVVLWTGAVSLVMAIGLGVPTRVASIAWSDDILNRITVPEVPGQDPALVFVHTSWNERLSSRLQGAGAMRQDSVTSVLPRNTNCELHSYTVARIAGEERLPPIDLEQRSGKADGIIRPPTTEGASFRTRADEVLTPACVRQLNADRFGDVSLAPLLWQGALPGIEDERPLFVRDHGPELNAGLLRHYADRTAWVFVPKGDEQPPELVPYDEAMRVLWGGGYAGSPDESGPRPTP